MAQFKSKLLFQSVSVEVEGEEFRAVSPKLLHWLNSKHKFNISQRDTRWEESCSLPAGTGTGTPLGVLAHLGVVPNVLGEDWWLRVLEERWSKQGVLSSPNKPQVWVLNFISLQPSRA